MKMLTLTNPNLIWRPRCG